MPKMHVQKSININAPVDKVFNTINDFHTWPTWSPWLITEPEANVTIREDGKHYEWEGHRTGAGSMSILNESAPNTVDYDLTFLKPWKSTAKVKFNCEAQGDTTKVTWYMDSSLPWFMFWMKKSMTAFIGMDYDRGLNMLKEYVEDGKIHSQLEFKGESNFEGGNFVGIKRDTTMTNVGPDMEKDFTRLHVFLKENNLEVVGYPFSQYHKFDMVKDKVSYTSGFPVNAVPQNMPAGIISGQLPASKIYKLRHVGPYKHLGNAWSTMHAMIRSKQIKPVSGYHPFELYANDPAETPTEELITDICFAVK